MKYKVIIISKGILIAIAEVRTLNAAIDIAKSCGDNAEIIDNKTHEIILNFSKKDY